MSKPKVSVIVPIWNVEKYLKRCVNSLINQTLKDIEIILIDDESPDNCPKICEDYAKRDKRVKVIHQKNQGLAGARNTGLRHAKGDYVIFVDSDDFLIIDACKVAYKAIKKTHQNCLAFKDCQVKNDKADLKKITASNEERTLMICDNLKELQLKIIDGNPYFRGFPVASACSKLYKRSFLIKNKLFFNPNIRYGEDGVFSLRVYEKLDTYAQLNYIGYIYYYVNSSIRNRYNANFYEELFEQFAAHEEFVKKYHKNDHDYYVALGKRCIKMIGQLEHKTIYHKDNPNRTNPKPVYLKFLDEPVVQKYSKYPRLKDFSSPYSILRFRLFNKKNLNKYIKLMKFYYLFQK